MSKTHRKQTLTRRVCHRNVDPTKTAQWMRVKDLSGLSAVQIAMLNNLEVLALQQQKIVQRLDLLLEAMDR